MNFEKLFISKHYQGGLTGWIEFKNELGSIELQLPDELAQQLLALCADNLVAISKQAADEMTAKVIEAVTPTALASDSDTGENG